MLDLRKVCKQFGTDPAVDALIDVDLVLQRGEWLSITGPSGSGKSTLLNVLGCLDRPTRGQYLFDGIETATLSENERAGLRSQRVGFIFQSFHLLPYRTVLENVMPVMMPIRSPSRTNNALLSISRIICPAASMVSPASMKAAGCRNSSEIRERINEP